MPFRPREVIVHPDVQSKFDRLEELASLGKKPARTIWKALQTAVNRIKADGQWGEVIPPTDIPRVFVSQFGITNLYCVDLPAFHRLFYTVRERSVIFIDILDHPEYDRIMSH